MKRWEESTVHNDDVYEPESVKSDKWEKYDNIRQENDTKTGSEDVISYEREVLANSKNVERSEEIEDCIEHVCLKVNLIKGGLNVIEHDYASDIEQSCEGQLDVEEEAGVVTVHNVVNANSHALLAIARIPLA